MWVSVGLSSVGWLTGRLYLLRGVEISADCPHLCVTGSIYSKARRPFGQIQLVAQEGFLVDRAEVPQNRERSLGDLAKSRLRRW